MPAIAIKRTYHLDQQTPMVHFQSDEEGATLRASEVKPKLDRFIIAQLGDGDYKKGVKEALSRGWLVGNGEHPALNYKLRFVACGEPNIDEPHDLYFGNIGVASEKRRKTVFYPNGVDMTVICSNEDMHERIEFFLPVFFVLHAFGTRSSKGFGCYAIGDIPAALEQYCPMRAYYFIEYQNKKTYEKFLDDIWVISGMIKSGFNFTFRHSSDYYKGHIFRYYSDKGIGGDKAFIKQKILNRAKDDNLNSEEKSSYNEFRFVRAMLGLPGGFEFKSGPKTTRRDKVEVQSTDIERFQSPVHFRVQGKTLLIIPQTIPEKMIDTVFSLNGHAIKTPLKFDLIDFLDSFCARFNSRTVIANFESKKIRRQLITDTRLMLRKAGGEST